MTVYHYISELKDLKQKRKGKNEKTHNLSLSTQFVVCIYFQFSVLTCNI